MNAPSIEPAQRHPMPRRHSGWHPTRRLPQARAVPRAGLPESVAAVRPGKALLPSAGVGFEPNYSRTLISTMADMPGTMRPSAAAGALAVEDDPHRHALDDLGEVTGRVVRRQQRELRAAGRSDALHPPRQHPAGEGIHAQPHRLPGPNAIELRLLEVRRHPDIRLDQRQQRLPWLDAVAGFQVLLPDAPGGRGNDLACRKAGVRPR